MNKELINKKEYQKIYYLNHKNYFRKYYQKNKKRLEYLRKKYLIKRKKYIKNQQNKYWKIYYLLNKEKICKQAKLRYKKNRNKYIKNLIIRRKKRLKIDINFRIKEYLRNRLRAVLKGQPKLSTTMKLVGCSIDKLKKHLEKRFKPSMVWNNYGKWHIDHIKPCASFDLSKPKEQAKCFNYTNLQPLWAEENLKKGSK